MKRRIDALITESGLRIVTMERFVMPETPRTLGEMYKGLPRWATRERFVSDGTFFTEEHHKRERSREGNQSLRSQNLALRRK